jgi:hypothetical protein
MAISSEFESSGPFSDGMAAVELNGQWGYVDKSGKMVIPPQFTFVSQFCDGIALTRRGEEWAYIDKMGLVVLSPGCDSNGAEDFSDGLAAISMGGALEPARNTKEGNRLVGSKMGFIDKRGNVVIKPQFLSAGNFSEGLAAVGPDGIDDKGFFVDRRGFIDRTGQLVIPADFDWAGDFRDGVALVRVGDEYGYIDKTGKCVWKPTR